MPDLAPYAVWWGGVAMIEGAFGLWLGYRFAVLGRRRGRWMLFGSSVLFVWGFPWLVGWAAPSPDDEWARRLAVMFLLLMAGWLGYSWTRVRELETVRRVLEEGTDGRPDG